SGWRMPHSARLGLDRMASSRLLLIFGLLLASAYAAPMATPVHLFLLLGAGVVLIILRWPAVGLAALIAANEVVPFAVGTGTETTISITVLLLFLLTGIWIVGMLVRRNLGVIPSRPILPLAALVIVAVLAFLSGLQPWLAFADTA